VDLFEIGMAFDWLTPLAAFVQDWVNEGGHTFVMPEAYMPVAMRDVCQALAAYDIHHWGVMLVEGYWMVTVPPDGRALLARRIIEGLGCWIEYGR